jgi:tetratricopeptide (TPR) repeat protein
MKKRGLIFLAGFAMARISLAAPLPKADPVYELFDDESDRMVITQIPVELDPISLGFDAASEARLKSFLNPASVQASLSAWVDQSVMNEATGSNRESSLITKPAPLNSTPALALLMGRANAFEKANVPSIACEEYAYALRLYPKNKELSQALESLSAVEYKSLMKDALAAQKSGDAVTALAKVNQALAVSPKDADAVQLKQKLLQDQKLQSELDARVSGDYRKGIELYQKGQLDLALASFVRVLNLDPNNKGALDYIQKIGERLKATPEAVKK